MFGKFGFKKIKMIKKHKSNTRKTWLFDGDSPKNTWRRHVGRNKKIHMIESKKKVGSKEDDTSVTL